MEQDEMMDFDVFRLRRKPRLIRVTQRVDDETWRLHEDEKFPHVGQCVALGRQADKETQRKYAAPRGFEQVAYGWVDRVDARYVTIRYTPGAIEMLKEAIKCTD